MVAKCIIRGYARVFSLPERVAGLGLTRDKIVRKGWDPLHNLVAETGNLSDRSTTLLFVMPLFGVQPREASTATWAFITLRPLPSELK